MNRTTKTQISAELQERIGMPKCRARKCVTEILDIIQTHLKNGDAVPFVGFGTFKVIETKERTMHNPRNGEQIIVKASKKVRFKPCPDFLNS